MVVVVVAVVVGVVVVVAELFWRVGKGGGGRRLNVPATDKAHLRNGSAQTFYICFYSETKFADQTSYFTLSWNVVARPTSASTEPMMLGVWQGCH